MNKFAPFIVWLWSKRDVDRAFHVGVLTEPHRVNDSSIPSPGLTTIESMDLFRLLEKKDLVSPHKPGETYLLNKVEAYKWEELIRELKTPEWMRSRWYTKLMSIIWVVLAALVGGFIGGYVKKMGEKAADLTVKIVEERATPVSAPKKQVDEAPSSKADKK